PFDPCRRAEITPIDGAEKKIRHRAAPCGGERVPRVPPAEAETSPFVPRIDVVSLDPRHLSAELHAVTSLDPARGVLDLPVLAVGPRGQKVGGYETGKPRYADGRIGSIETGWRNAEADLGVHIPHRKRLGREVDQEFVLKPADFRCCRDSRRNDGCPG